MVDALPPALAPAAILLLYAMSSFHDNSSSRTAATAAQPPGCAAYGRDIICCDLSRLAERLPAGGSHAVPSHICVTPTPYANDLFWCLSAKRDAACWGIGPEDTGCCLQHPLHPQSMTLSPLLHFQPSPYANTPRSAITPFLLDTESTWVNAPFLPNTIQCALGILLCLRPNSLPSLPPTTFNMCNTQPLIELRLAFGQPSASLWPTFWPNTAATSSSNTPKFGQLYWPPPLPRLFFIALASCAALAASVPAAISPLPVRRWCRHGCRLSSHA